MGSRHIEGILRTKGWEIHLSLGDGHCLLQSIITLCHSQLTWHPLLSLGSIILKITEEIENNVDDYLLLAFTKASLSKQMKAYLWLKDYNSDFGNLVPLILARIYYITVTILDTLRTGTVTEHIMYPRVKQHHLLLYNVQGTITMAFYSSYIDHRPPISCRSSRESKVGICFAIHDLRGRSVHS